MQWLNSEAAPEMTSELWTVSLFANAFLVKSTIIIYSDPLCHHISSYFFCNPRAATNNAIEEDWYNYRLKKIGQHPYTPNYPLWLLHTPYVANKTVWIIPRRQFYWYCIRSLGSLYEIRCHQHHNYANSVIQDPTGHSITYVIRSMNLGINNNSSVI